jgi:large subunit ribosomal protein L22
MRVIANLIRGKDVASAINSLRFLNKSGAREFFKLVVSAVANAEDLGETDVEGLIVSEVTVDQGPTLRRWRPRAQGRGTRVQKKTSHVMLRVSAPEAT